MSASIRRSSVSTGSPYEPIIGFSRAVRVGTFISISGTAPIGPDGIMFLLVIQLPRPAGALKLPNLP